MMTRQKTIQKLSLEETGLESSYPSLVNKDVLPDEWNAAQINQQVGSISQTVGIQSSNIEALSLTLTGPTPSA